jgi:predicted esterase
MFSSVYNVALLNIFSKKKKENYNRKRNNNFFFFFGGGASVYIYVCVINSLPLSGVYQIISYIHDDQGSISNET